MWASQAGRAGAGPAALEAPGPAHVNTHIYKSSICSGGSSGALGASGGGGAGQLPGSSMVPLWLPGQPRGASQ